MPTKFPIQPHSHNGSDSGRISFDDLLNKPYPINLRYRISCLFENSARYDGSAIGTASVRTFDTNGVTLTSGTSSFAISYLHVLGDLASLKIFDMPMVFQFNLNYVAESDGTHRAFMCVNSPGTHAVSYTKKHFGFEIVSQLTNKIRGTVGNGSSRVTVDLDISGLTLSDDHFYQAVYLPSKGVAWYIDGKLVGQMTDISQMPNGIPTDTSHYIEVQTVRDNTGTTVNTILLRNMLLDFPLEGKTQKKLS